MAMMRQVNIPAKYKKEIELYNTIKTTSKLLGYQTEERHSYEVDFLVFEMRKIEKYSKVMIKIIENDIKYVDSYIGVREITSWPSYDFTSILEEVLENL